jgi:hypothetical protein
MNKENGIIWDNLTFKTINYCKNFDLVNDNENIITEHAGTISEIRIVEHKPPIIAGEFGLSVWNIELGKKFNVNFNKLIEEHKFELMYSELMKIIQNKNIDIEKFDKLILVNNLMLHPNYRKHGVTEEFVEYLHRVFYAKNDAIIALVMPFQNNPVDADFYFNQQTVEIRHSLQKTHEFETIPAHIYYSLNEFQKKTDKELNEYKLFSVATKCGFNRLDNSYLFIYSPEKIFQRMLKKREKIKKVNVTV